jgi:hypothetical protein
LTTFTACRPVGLLASHPSGKFCRVILNTAPIGAALVFIRSGLRRQHWRDHGVERSVATLVCVNFTGGLMGLWVQYGYSHGV